MKPSDDGSRKVVASRSARVVSVVTPEVSPAAAAREAAGNIAVASDTVSNECGRIQIRYAFWYAFRPAPAIATCVTGSIGVAVLARLVTTTWASEVNAT